MIAVICAMSIEAEALKSKLENIQIIDILNKTFYKGHIDKQEVVLVVCGIGKVASGVVTALLIEHFHPSLIINSGIAGGYAKHLKTLDLVVAKNVAYYDVDLTADGQEYGRMQGYPKYFDCSLEVLSKIAEGDYHFGTIITADTFASNRDYLDLVVTKEYCDANVLAVDMESAAIAQVCYDNNTSFINIRVISDIIGEDSQLAMYYNFGSSAAAATVKTILKIINSMC